MNRCEDRPMNRLYLLLVICFAILGGGCGPAAKDQLVGRWQGAIELNDEKMQEKLSGSPQRHSSMGSNKAPWMLNSNWTARFRSR